MFKEQIEGEFISLAKITVADAGDIYQWRSGVSGKFLRQPADYSLESQQQWIQSRNDQEINYLISDKITKEKIGTISIYDVNHADKVANVGRLLLADKWLSRSNPYGLEALLLCYGYVFESLHFRKITGDLLATNETMFKLQVYLGMKQEGLLSKHVYVNGNYDDLHIMSLFADDFETKYKKRINIFLRAFK